MKSIHEISGLPYTNEEFIKHKDSLMNILDALKEKISEHSSNVAKNEASTRLVNFYDAAANYLSSAKALLNSTKIDKNRNNSMSGKRTSNRYYHSLLDLSAAYSRVIN
ncbi:hypothetical protein [Pinibacter soli]|uniref:Uncharacterized protein n=1 Tax=Pinibacter soli TaxID=3044211 RepID=A0ABT6RDV2_9BACT|nr:hypothetical protein [Pinibacter soli]MDI3320752.1 hypothetical protein [Pinibacter soli]